MKVHFVAYSRNKKTGGIPVTYSERDTCPTTCPFYDKGCYAKYGPAAIQWRKVANTGEEWVDFIKNIRYLPNNQLWRHNVAGDLPHNNGIIDNNKLKMLVRANKNKNGFTYSHHVLNEDNIATIKESNAGGFTINSSCESVERADEIMTEYGIPAVAVIDSKEERRFYTTEKGRKVIVCPATIHENVNCSTCGLCAVSDRNYIIGFKAHGVAKKTVDSIVGN
jgi:hypothetical protein